MSLLTLSLWRAPRHIRAMPHVPTNAERVRIYRALAGADSLGNAYPWPWRKASLQPSAATATTGLAASLTAQPQPFADEQRVRPEAGRMRTETGPVAAPGSAYDTRRPPSSPSACATPPPAAGVPFDPDSLDVTSDDEPDLPWIGFEGDPDMDIPEF